MIRFKKWYLLSKKDRTLNDFYAFLIYFQNKINIISLPSFDASQWFSLTFPA